MFIIKHKTAFFLFTALVTLAALAAIAAFGLHLGIDFKGGTLLSVTYEESRPTVADLETSVRPLGYGEVRIQPSDDKDLLVRTREISTAEKDALLLALSLSGSAPLTEKSFTAIGPSIGKELTNKAVAAIIAIVLALLAFITFAFRNVSKPVSSWKYAVIAIVTLVHDMLVPMGVFAYLGFARGAEVDSLFVVALLAILGISINDTIVVFDRVRENLRRREEMNTKEPFDETVGKSLNQTIVRSINTSLTVVFVLLALFFFGPETTKNFALMLTVGMIAGTYSSIFLASPLLVVWERYAKRT